MSDIKDDVHYRQEEKYDSRDGSDRHSSEDGLDKLPITMGWLSTLAAGWNVCNSWIGVGATLALSISFQGGSVTLLYGLIVILFTIGSTALSLAELAARYPTAGGMYHWTAVLAPANLRKGLSYTCGAMNIFSWITIVVSLGFIIPQFITALAIFYHPTYAAPAWHLYLEFLAITLISLLINIFALKKIMWTQHVGLVMSLGLFFIITVTCLAMSSPKQSASFVWATFLNGTGWTSNAPVFLGGLVNPAFMYSGIDGAIHLAEDCANAALAVPRAIVGIIIIGFVTSFVFCIAMLYSFSSYESVAGALLPLFEIWIEATNTKAAIAFMILVIIMAIFAINAAVQTSSRLTWSFARDDALVFSKFIGRIHPTFQVPVWALVFNQVVAMVVGVVYVGSTTAFYAIIGTGTVLQQLSFAIPIILLMMKRRGAEYLPTRGFRLGAAGWILNIIAVIWTCLSTIVFNLPVFRPVTGATMNYTCFVLGAMGIFAVINYLVYARRRYHGPKIAVEARGFT